MAGANSHPSCIVRERKTRFVDILRTTPTDTVCPNFFVLSHANGCTFSPQCSYCYLKSSLWHVQEQQAFGNTGKLLDEVRAWIAKDRLESYVLNTGNLSDSLCFEPFRPLIRELVELFRSAAEAKGRQHALLLVTKGGRVECKPLLDAKPCRNVIVSFSVNSRKAAARYERGAATVRRRLLAAAELKRQGWRVRIRIDPMIAGYDYKWVIEQVRGLAPERVTLGTLRAEPNLKRRIGNGIFSALEPSKRPNGLARYPKAVRLAIYGQAVAALAGVCSIGLCEETPDIWEAVGLDTAEKACNCNN